MGLGILSFEHRDVETLSSFETTAIIEELYNRLSYMDDRDIRSLKNVIERYYEEQ